MQKIRYLLQQSVRTALIHQATIQELEKCKQNADMGYLENIPMPEIEKMPIYEYTLPEFIHDGTFLVPDIYTALLQEVIYYPKRDTIFTSSRKLIADSVMNHFKPEKYSVRTLYFSRQERISGTCSVFRSIFDYRNYYHTLTDHLPRLYLLDRHEKTEKVKLLIPGKLTKAEEFFLEKMLPKNVEILPVEAEKIFRVEKLLFPSFLTYRNSGYLPKTYLEYFHEKVLPKYPRNKRNLIYISRKLTGANSKRCILNEAELVEKLDFYGFKKYSLETMSIAEQIELFYNAKCVVSPHGAGLANIIFSEGIKVLEMFPSSHMLPHYYFLSKALGHDYMYWCGQAADKEDNFVVDSDRIGEIVRDLL